MNEIEIAIFIFAFLALMAIGLHDVEKSNRKEKVKQK